MPFSMTSLMNTINQLVTHERKSVEATEFKVGSLQDHLMSLHRASGTLQNSELEGDWSAEQSANKPVQNAELSVGPPPLYRSENKTNVVGMPKRKGSRIIYWTQVAPTNQAA